LIAIDATHFKIGILLIEFLSPAEIARVFRARDARIEVACVNCDQLFQARYRFLYCSEVCQQTASTVRWVRRKLKDETFGRIDIHDAMQIQMGHILSGGYPERARKLRPAVRAEVMARADGHCERCRLRFEPGPDGGDLRPTIQHMRGSSNEMADLRAFCFGCNTKDALSRLRPATLSTRKRAQAIERSWLSELPTRACDDQYAWQTTWRAIAERRFAGGV
jgi:hypothetical protein